ncbi:SigE family RNA polymerase sigma factor [Embleya scabrispora]|uniref:SigE family RNA polymerase sigma factor n=1 Tax=Embleya scabrispora TaxID=159449 RepID=UPI000360A1DD|nr:SigE family RNA polymerase sigma factor [Embleya scabrispora]MYS80191.1 SigE family RNA polymerase sigma factor [Streptomyces sp. SID5474]
MKTTKDEEFRDFMTSRWPRLLRTAFLLTGGHHHDAEDLAQSTLARVYAKWDHVRGSDNIDGYVRRIMVHVHTDRHRRTRIREWITTRVPETPTADRTARLDERDVLMTALARLPARQRAAVVLCYFEDMSQSEIAAALGVGLGTAKSQVSRGLAKLRRDGALNALRPAADITARKAAR